MFWWCPVDADFYPLQSLLSPPATNIQPLPEYKTAVAERSRWVLSHYGVAKTCWDVLVLLATIFVAIAVPWNAAFHEPGRIKRMGFALDVVAFSSSCFASTFLVLQRNASIETVE